MKKINLICLMVSLGALTGLSSNAKAETTVNLDRSSNAALSMLIKTDPLAAEISKKAKAVLVFPNIIKAGLVFGGAYGEGVMIKSKNIEGYYNSVTASFGWQAGGESYGYVVFLMSEKAIMYIHDTHGLEFGIGPSIVIVNKGVAKNLSTSSLKEDAYAFIFDQQGLMASLSIEGMKITRINR